jgi:endoglucanase
VTRRLLVAALAALAAASCAGGAPPGAAEGGPGGGRDGGPGRVGTVLRVNAAGYRPGDPKVAVACSLEPADIESFVVRRAGGALVVGPRTPVRAGSWGPCVIAHHLDFSDIRETGEYVVEAGGARARVRVGSDVHAGAADTLLFYMRQQRSGYNPLFRDSVHVGTDGILVDHARAGEFIPVAGGWADAADYLQYVTTSAHATTAMLLAHRDHPGAFDDRFGADGLPGPNGLPDVLDEARWGLEWLVAMYPEDDLLLNQLGDDRDHAFWDLPPTDSSDYGWGRGGYRPVYPCTAAAQGLLGNRNRSDGMASTAGKVAAALALGAMTLGERDPAFAATLGRKARAAYDLGRRYPGVCQTAPGGAPYFYEEENWVDDMELAAAELHALTGDPAYLGHALEYAAREPVTPWMGRDTARHYQWYPWHNYGHYEVWRVADEAARATMAEYYRRGLEAVVARADPAFGIGVPFIWCSNNLVAAFATQALLYRRMTGDTTFTRHEAAARDWLLGRNPWGVSMVIGYPAAARTPRSPHSVVADRMGIETQLGGLVDGPVYRSIFESLRGIALLEPDELAAFNTGPVVYHDDMGDYSTNEPIMDGTANLVYLWSALATGPRTPGPGDH